MFGLFKRKEDTPERAAKKMAIDDTVAYAQQQADDLITEIRRRRERKLLQAALKDGTNGG